MSHPEPSASDVQEILDTSLDTSSLEAHIDAASHELSDIKIADPNIADDRLTDIHKYLAAHYATGQEPLADSQSGESRSISYARDEGTNYGKIAKRLDPTGELQVNVLPKASLSVPDTKGISDR